MIQKPYRNITNPVSFQTRSTLLPVLNAQNYSANRIRNSNHPPEPETALRYHTRVVHNSASVIIVPLLREKRSSPPRAKLHCLPPITNPSRRNHFAASRRFQPSSFSRRLGPVTLDGRRGRGGQSWISKEKTIFRDGYIIGKRGATGTDDRRVGGGGGESHVGYKARREYS